MGELSEQQRARARLRVGTVLNGKWTLDTLLGIGGMAAVYAATHRNKKRSAIKMLHPEYSASPEMRTRFLREGYVANSVGHPAVVSVDDDDVSEDGSAFLVMELLEGETVEERGDRKGGQLSPVEVLAVADQLLDVLAVAHDKGVVHRDIKPENLFLTSRGVLKVLDFGIARLREMTAPISATRTGSLMGTPAFMAPEQARGRWDDVDGRTDLWAVGATMFDLLAGRPVHEAETANEALALAITQPAPSLASVASDVEPRIVALVDRALAYDKSDRFQSARDMQDAVCRVYSELTGAAGRPPALSVSDVVIRLIEPRASAPAIESVVSTSPGTESLASAVTLASSGASAPAQFVDPPAAPARRWRWVALAGVIAVVAGVAVIAGSADGSRVGSTAQASLSAPIALTSEAPAPVMSQAPQPVVSQAPPVPAAAPSASETIAKAVLPSRPSRRPAVPRARPAAADDDPLAKRR